MTASPSTGLGTVEKLTDVVGLYLHPPEQAIVLCVDAKFKLWIALNPACR